MRPASRIDRPVLFILLCALAVACSGPSAPVVEPAVEADPTATLAPRITPNPTLPARAYTDGTGTVLEFVPVKVRDVEGVHAIIRLSGVGEPYEGRPMLATRAFLDEGGNDWRVMVDGRRRTIIMVSKKRLGTSEMLLALGGKKRRRIMVSHDVESSRYVDSAKLLALHQQAVESGEAKRFESVDRARHIQEGMIAQKSQEEDLEAACGEAIPMETAWDEIPDEQVGPQHFCNSVVQVLSALCARNENSKADVIARVSKVRCLVQTAEGSVALTSEGILQVHRPKLKRAFMQRVLDDTVTNLMELKEIVLRSKAGTYVVINHRRRDAAAVHAGWPPNLHEQLVVRLPVSGEMYLWSGALDVRFRRSGLGKYLVDCPGEKTEFDEVSVEERDRFLKTATFGKRMWPHEPLALARDGDTYYYIDRLTRDEGQLGYRLFKGPRGAVKQVELRDVVDDPVNVLFMMARSQLAVRLKGGGVESVTLGKGKRSRPIQMLSLGSSTNRSLVYNDLGAYDGQVLGGICDLGLGGQP